MYSHVLLTTGARDWCDISLIRATFNDIWRDWTRRSRVTRPLLVSGHSSRGADVLAERVWTAARFEILRFPADWSRKRAGRLPPTLERNQQMVDFLVAQRGQGAHVRCAAFIRRCAKPDCPRAGERQLMPNLDGHFSHGTMHCRARAITAGIETIDVLHPSLIAARPPG